MDFTTSTSTQSPLDEKSQGGYLFFFYLLYNIFGSLGGQGDRRKPGWNALGESVPQDVARWDGLPVFQISRSFSSPWLIHYDMALCVLKENLFNFSFRLMLTEKPVCSII